VSAADEPLDLGEDLEEPRCTTVITDNLAYLFERNYFTNTEAAFLNMVSCMLEPDLNGIVEYEFLGDHFVCTGKFLSITKIAKVVRWSRSTVSKVVNSLVRKGVLYEGIVSDSRSARMTHARPLYMNPEILFAGDVFHMNPAACYMVMARDILEQNGLKLLWKVWVRPDAKWGRLYRRSTYVRLRRKVRDAPEFIWERMSRPGIRPT